MIEKKLPEFVAPMLAKSAEPFDSSDFLFEIKWDGTRALAFVERDGYRFVNRRGREVSERYPELEFLEKLDPGTVLDGEIVVLRDGKPDFGLLMSREHGEGSLRRRSSAVRHPATFVAFDQLFANYRSLAEQPLQSRREVLRQTVTAASDPRCVFSDGIRGRGKTYFEKVCDQGLEGVMAKRLDSRYHAGKRSDAWLKIKRRHSLLCAIIGYVPAGDDAIKSLIIAAEDDGELRCVGKVGSGISAETNAELHRRLRERARAAPVIPCRFPGKWVEPGLYCTVTYQERTRTGQLRAPVFERLVVE